MCVTQRWMHPISYKDVVISGAQRHVCDDNVCACAVGALFLHPVTNLLTELD